MARQKSQVEANQYVLGIITEAGRMTFPENASVYEKNFVLHPSGKRERRKGLELMGDLIKTDGTTPTGRRMVLVVNTLYGNFFMLPNREDRGFVNGVELRKVGFLLHLPNEVGEYELEIEPTPGPSFFQPSYGSNPALVGIKSFGTLFGRDVAGVTFGFCENLQWCTAALPEQFTHLGGMFSNCYIFTGSGLEGWNTSKVTNVRSLFERCSMLNVDLGMWDVSEVREARRMFFECTVFNADLGGWSMPHYTSEPDGFSFGCVSWVLPKPTWGE